MKRSARFQYLGAVAVLAVAALQVYGCGGQLGALDGTSGSQQPGHASGSITGGFDTARAILTEGKTVPATGGLKLPSLTVTLPDGQTKTLTDVMIPSQGNHEVTLLADTPVIIIYKSSKTYVSGSFTNNAPVTINGQVDNGFTIKQDGTLTRTIVLPLSTDAAVGSQYTLSIPRGKLTARTLNVAKAEFGGIWYYIPSTDSSSYQVLSPLPLTFSGQIPNNGENAAGSRVTVTFQPGNDGRQCSLRVAYGNGFVLQQTKTISGNSATFENLTTDTVNVPNGGVELVSFTVGPKP